METLMKTAIVGLGYVGLPLSLQFAISGVEVLGLDIDPVKVDSLNKGKSYIKHIPSKTILAQLTARKFSASTDFKKIRTVEAVIICVPTPLNKNREPDISYILKTGEAIAPHLRKGMVTPAVVRAFASVGWGWGGSWSGSTKDYMHFSFNGH